MLLSEGESETGKTAREDAKRGRRTGNGLGRGGECRKSKRRNRSSVIAVAC